jgi:DNA-binding NarL/FixJ family response regulator
MIAVADAAVLSKPDLGPSDAALDVLSPREREVARLIRSGLRNKEIAALLGTSVETVRKQTISIYEKLGVSVRVELVSHFGEGLAAVEAWPK